MVPPPSTDATLTAETGSVTRIARVGFGRVDNGADERRIFGPGTRVFGLALGTVASVATIELGARDSFGWMQKDDPRRLPECTLGCVDQRHGRREVWRLGGGSEGGWRWRDDVGECLAWQKA